MTPWIVLGCILLFFLLLLSLKVKIVIGYCEEVTLTVRILGINIRLLPKKPVKASHSMSAAKAKRIRKKAAKKAKEKQEKKEQKELKKQQKKDKPKKSVSEILDLIDLIRKLLLAVLRRFFKHLRIDIARMKIKVATGDAATTAVAYGAVSQAVNVLLPSLETVKNFGLPKTTDLDIQADFLSDSCEADILLAFSLRVWHVFHVAFGALFAFIKHKLSKV